MQPLNEHELMLVRGMIAERQAAADRRTDQNLELVALKDENEQLREENRAKLEKQQAAIDRLSDTYCEGYCTESGGKGRFEDCTGCHIYAVSLEDK